MKAEQHCKDEISLRIIKKQVELTYHKQPFSLFTTFLVAVFVIGFLYSPDIIGRLLVCLALFTLVVIFRSYIHWRYTRACKNYKVNVELAEKQHFFGTLFSGMAWAVLTLLLFPVVELHDQIFLLIVVMGVIATAHTTMGSLRAPTFSFIMVLTLPLMYAVFYSDLPNAAMIIFAIIVHSIIMLRSSSLYYDSTLNMLRSNEIAIQREHKLMLQTAKARAANEEKSKFLSRMSHELRTPLNAIMGMNELLLRDTKDPLTEKQRDRSQKVVEAGKHLLSIVDDVLDLARIEAGNVDMTMALTNCQAVIRGSIKLVEAKALQRNITISSNLGNADVFVMADSKRLKQIIVNLLDNAVKYNKQGGQISIILDVDDSDVTRISFIDTGYGIDESATDKLFKPFSRLGAEKLGIDGTGIGLSLCKQFIELMHGKIGVECRKGDGCCFWIELPYVEHTAIVESKPIEKKNNVVIVETGEQKKLLLVEDNLVNCEVALDMLDELGFYIDVVHDGKQAVAAVNENRYDLVLMDCEMPVMDGYTATEKIRSNEKLLQKKPMPIIALTAHAIAGARDKCIASGMDDFLSKPFSLATLQLMVNKWLKIKAKTSIKSFDLHKNQDDVNILHDISAGSAELDRRILNRLYNKKNKSGSSLVEKVIKIYLEQSPRLLAELIQATKKEDVEAARGVLHTLKSSSMNVGATGLSALCKKAERACEQGSIEKNTLDQVHKTYFFVEEALNNVLQSVK